MGEAQECTSVAGGKEAESDNRQIYGKGNWL